MILKAIFCFQHLCSFGALLFILNLLIKTESTVICGHCHFFDLRTWEFEEKVFLVNFQENNLNIYDRFRERSMFLDLIDWFALTFYQCCIENLGVETHL